MQVNRRCRFRWHVDFFGDQIDGRAAIDASLKWGALNFGLNGYYWDRRIRRLGFRFKLGLDRLVGNSDYILIHNAHCLSFNLGLPVVLITFEIRTIFGPMSLVNLSARITSVVFIQYFALFEGELPQLPCNRCNLTA